TYMPLWFLAFMLGACCESVYDFIIPHTQAFGLSMVSANGAYSALLLGAVVLQLPLSCVLHKAQGVFRQASVLAIMLAISVSILPVLGPSVPAVMGMLVGVGGLTAALAVLADTFVCKTMPRNMHSQGLQFSELVYVVGGIAGAQTTGYAMDVAGPVWGHAAAQGVLACVLVGALLLMILRFQKHHIIKTLKPYLLSAA
ncbi:MAG: hypothetical protein WAZ18_06230, partial [Alphaproteobacteria bacterium]